MKESFLPTETSSAGLGERKGTRTGTAVELNIQGNLATNRED